MDGGCVFPAGLLAIVEFYAERMSFYTEDYTEFYQESKRDIEESQNKKKTRYYRDKEA